MSDVLYVAIPGDPATVTGGYAYDRRMIEALRRAGRTVELVSLPGSYPVPSAADLDATCVAFRALPDGALVLVDGLAFGAMPEIAAAERDRLRLVALVHHPLALETGLSAADAERLRVSESEALAQARLVVTTSPATARALRAGFGVPAERLVAVLPGVDRARPSDPPSGPQVILCVATITPRKGHDVLVEALALLADRTWTCRLVGDPTRAPETATRLRRQIASVGLEARIALAGIVPDIAAEYAGASIFALASRFEGYGMVFAEALAQGLPIVACAAGAVPDVVPRNAGLLVPPDDPVAFAAALGRLLDDPPLRRRYAEGARIAGEALPGWDETAAALARAMDGVAP
ncbi:glycosyltransferase family 4 protein [Aureimonas sp. AU12]|uniref:glycosyltransferase family 4 protein n=1 Tax=Aureimonas sp. AU12 TaxID=1638161 RepID=UPI000780E02B|nr:glycosyltransferase family 4 protein [Aureimonas sp. AU12]